MIPVPTRHAMLAAALGVLLTVPAAGAQNQGARPPSDLDAFMSRVLERRDESWRKLHDYVLDETERIDLTGPGRISAMGHTVDLLSAADLKMFGQVRDFTWFVREGFLVRSPTRANGVAVGEAERVEYERKWLESEKKREERRRERAAKKEKPTRTASEHDPQDVNPDSAGLDVFVDQRGEPRFMSEAYFLNFRFEPGNYSLVGREAFEGREVYRIEYYPTKLFGDEGERKEQRKPEPKRDAGIRVDRNQKRTEVTIDAGDEEEIERKLNKIALITLWVDPAEYQIVKYTFDNVDFGFLPGRWIVQVDQARASMTMGRFFDGVWLPREISMQVGLRLANGDLRFTYGRAFRDYRRAETSARFRVIRDGGL